ncbi:MAG TPA: hypothetical protein VFE58_02375 [Tepidisphaeraceae bacterium]|jgi:hypothetical protein|nr:hypothetical protein [Tepidisphaeraceae bacterium]
MNAKFVANTLLWFFGAHGVPWLVRLDNGSWFIAEYLMWALASSGVEARHVEPGSP